MNSPSFPARLWRRLRNVLVYHLSDQSRTTLQDRFTRVYRDQQWAGWTGRHPVSGKGSSLDATAGLRGGLFQAMTATFTDPTLLRIVDAPCGDMTWMPDLLARLATHYQRVEYIGIDIVPELVAANRALVPPAGNVTMRFECLDITRDKLPPGDVVICRDLLNHLRNIDVARLQQTLQQSSCRYAILSSNTGHTNQELVLNSPGASRAVDLQAAPFLLPPPVIAGKDGPSMWRLPFWG